jgi:predicted ATPase/DNA-binding CsgD family transcriptional regulator
MRPDVSSFVGRRRELTVVKELMANSRLLTLTGTGGVGKTRLARQLAEETHRAFPDGTWIVELADVQQDDFVAQTIANVWSLRDDTLEPMEQLTNYLLDKRLLLVVDNCEHLIDACAAVVGALLRCAPNIRILATSRQVLGVTGEQIYRVPPLSVPPWVAGATDAPVADAVALFDERARAANPDFTLSSQNRGTVGEICRRLDGVPLAIELAAVRLRVLSEEQIMSRLDDAIELLKTGPRTVPERQQRIEATLEWSYRLCSREEQRLWARLAVFAGPFCWSAIEAICADDAATSAEVLDALSGLVEKSVLSRRSAGENPRYQLPEVLRQFGRKRLVETGDEERVLDRHMEYYQSLTGRGMRDYCSPRDREWMAEITLEHANIRAALERALSRQETVTTAMQMASDLRPFWTHTGYLLEGYTWLTRALKADSASSLERARALSTCTWTALMLSQVPAAEEMLDECRKFEDDTDLEWLRAHIACNEALCRIYTLGLDSALARAEEAVQLTLAGDDSGLTADLMSTASILAFCTGAASAQQHAGTFLAFTVEHGANLMRGVALYMVGLGHWRDGDYVVAETDMNEAVQILASFDELGMLGAAIEGLGWLAASTNEPQRAAQLFGVVDRIWRVARLRIAEFITTLLGTDVRAGVRRSLGEAAWTAALEAGGRLSQTEGVDLALRVKPAKRAAQRELKLPSNLTRREVQIARLVGEGLSNKEIATQLVVSVRTAEAHVENILNKLSLHSRTQIAKWVKESLDERDPR